MPSGVYIRTKKPKPISEVTRKKMSEAQKKKSQ